MPPHHNPPAYPKSHAEQMSAANKKHYEPITWDNYFDELSFLDDVQTYNTGREPPHLGLAMKELYFSASMEQDILHKALLA